MLSTYLHRTGRATAAFLALLPLALTPAAALGNGGFEIGWSSIDGGAGTASDGQFAVSGTIGQPDVGTQSGDGYTVVGGFWNPVIVSGTSPTVSITPLPSLRNTPVTTITVTFSEPVLGLDASDFTLTHEGGADLITGSETLFTTDSVAWEVGDLAGLTASPDGLYEFALIASGSGVTDNFGNTLANDDAVSWTLDATPPTGSVTLTDVSPTSASLLNFAVSFSEDVSFTTSNLTLTGTLAPLGTPVISGSGDSYMVSVALSDPYADGTLGIRIETSVADPANNPIPAAIVSDLYVLDSTAPLAATPQDEGMVTSSPTVLFTWTPSTDVHGIYGYYLNVGTTPGGLDVFSGFVGNVLSYQVTGVEDAVLYASLSAIDTVGNFGPASAPSNGILVNAVDLHIGSPSLTGGNGDAIIDRNECHDVAIELTNVASTTLTSVSAVLESLTPGVTVSGDPVSYPDLAALQNAINTMPFVVQTDPDFRCGETIDLVLTVTAAEGTFNESWSLESGRPGFARFDASVGSMPIPDGTGVPPAAPGVVEVPLAVSGVTGELTGVTVSLHLLHPRGNDLVLELVAPDGTTALLADRRGGGQQAFGTNCTTETERTTFDDNAALLIGEAGTPFTGSYRPQELLLPLVLGKSGSGVNGVWKLRVSDIHGNGSVGSVECWSLGLTWKDCLDGSCGGVAISPSADLSVSKSASQALVYLDEPVTYTLVVENSGPDAATSVTISDTLPAGAVLLDNGSTAGNWTQVGNTLVLEVETLAADESVTATVVLAFSTTGTHVNSGFVSGNEFDSDTTNNSTSASVTVVPRPLVDLSVTKSADVAEVKAGDQITWTLVVTNSGPDIATNSILTDLLTADTVLASSSTTHGNIDVQGQLVTADLGTLGVDESATVTLTVQALAVGTTENTAFVAAEERDTDLSDNSASATVEVLSREVDLSVTKTSDVSEVAIGGSVTYTVTVTNSGPDTAMAVTVTDVLASSAAYVDSSASQGTVGESSGTVTAELGSLAPNSSATVTLNVTAGEVGTLSNSASAVSFPGDELDSTNNTGSVDVTVNPLRADISLTKTADAASVVQGATVTYTLTVTNNGPQTATNVVVTDTLDANATYVSSDTSAGTVSEVSGTVTALVGDLASGASATVTIVVTGDTIGTLNNSAAASADEQDLNSSNNTASVSVEVEDPAPVVDLVVGKSADQASVANGAAITYLITVYNAGPDDATSVTVLDPIDPSLTLVDVLPSQGDVEQINGTVSVDLGALAANTTATLEIVVQTGAAGQVLNSAFVTGAEADPVTDNNTDSVVVDVLAAADVRVSQTASRNPAALAEPFTFTVTVLNAGPDTATSVTLTDTLPAGATFGGATLSDGTYTVDSGVVTAEIGTLASGETATLTLSVTPQTTATLTNQASVSANEIDPVPSNNNSGLAVQVGSPFIPIVEDDFTTGTLDGTGGWVSFGFEIPGFANSEYDQAAGAYKAHIAPDPTRLRVAGVRAVGEALMPYSHVGPEKIVRAKYYLYAGGQSRTIDIPAIRLRAAIRFAQTSLLEVFTHTSLDPGVTPISTEMAPSSDPANPSLYRVDFDPVDVPSVVNNAATEGIMRAFEAYTTDVSDQGYVAMTESVLGTYAASSLPLTVAPIKVYAPAGGGAGNLSVNAGPGAFLTSATLIFGSEPGVPATVAPPSDGYSDYAEGAFGVTFDTTAVVADAVAVLTREFAPGDETTRVRVEEGKQYVVRFHATSTVPSEDNAMLNFRARSSKFSYTQRMILGGGHAASLANNQIAAESMPGIGTQNPDKDPGDITGGWYNVLVYTPLAKEIRPEFAPGTPLSTRMPDFTAEPGPGEAGASARDLRIGADIVDTLSRGFQYQLEQGHMTIDRIEVRSYDAIPD